MNDKAITIPNKLPLLEGLGWNIHNPYTLTPRQMLAIYEERWHYLDVLGKPSQEEIGFIKEITRIYQGLPLIETNNIDKEEFFLLIDLALGQLNIDLLIEHQVCLGGGALIGLKYQALRCSSNVDFLVNPQNCQQLKYAIRQGKTVLFKSKNLEIGEPRADRYGIRYPIIVRQGKREVKFKLEIIADNFLSIGKPELYKNIPCLNLEDLATAKLLVLSDRWQDCHKFSCDLIDLAIVCWAEKKLPAIAIDRANSIHPYATKLLSQAIKQFQASPDYRASCYKALQVSKTEAIASGLDRLAHLSN